MSLKASEAAGEPLWYRARSGIGRPYRPRHAVLSAQQWYVGDTERLGRSSFARTSTPISAKTVEWRFEPGLIYNGAKPLILHSVELAGLPGRGTAPGSLFLSWTRDGEVYSSERPLTIYPGERRKRIWWRPHIRFQTYLGLRIRGIGGQPGFSALEAALQPL
jgi:hypothetical protein